MSRNEQKANLSLPTSSLWDGAAGKVNRFLPSNAVNLYQQQLVLEVRKYNKEYITNSNNNESIEI